ncbi:hypothetical protein TrVFT333_010249 [Trichoderma virens FT-333]|nr:hypothetical protein TrVFT333_010249 [Trichoderma virens FT-333]
MERQSEWQREGSLGQTTLDSELIHMGHQLEETNIESDTNSGELAHATRLNYPQMEDDEIDEGSMVDKSSSPESSTESSNRWQEGKASTDSCSLSDDNPGWTKPSRDDPWTHLSLRHQATPAYLQELRQSFDSIKELSNRPADVAGITVVQSAQTDSGYASIPKDRLEATPKLQTRGAILESHSAASMPKISVVHITKDKVVSSQTVYSDESSVDASKTKEYIWEFTNYLYQQLSQQLTLQNIEETTNLLPRLLAAFALQMGRPAQTQISRDVMYFVYKHRRLITQSLKVIYEDDRTVTDREPDEDLMPTNDKIHLLWSKGFDADHSLDPKEDINLVSGFDDDEVYSPEGDFSGYRDAIMKDTAFNWLIERLSGELNLSAAESFAMKGIHHGILDNLLDGCRISRTRASKPFKVTFNVQCDIFAFVQEEEYHEHAADVVLEVITLTGANANTQATTSEQYLRQTWPKLRCNLLQTIQRALRVYDPAFPFRNSAAYTYADGTKIEVYIGERTFRVEAIGMVHSIAEIGEQIGWVATTFWSTPDHSRSWFCHPEILGFHIEDAQNLHAGVEEFEKAFVCKVTVVKGFSTALIPTMMQDDIIHWHLLVNKPGARIQYGDPRMLQGILVTSDQLRGARRHIVGWCANAQNNIGSSNANYDIKWSRLSHGTSGFAWEGLEFSVGIGGYLKASTTFKIGRKQRSRCMVELDGYQTIVNHIGHHYFTLYDVNERRAWLSDGQPVLLHLALASLKWDEKEKTPGFFTEAIERLNKTSVSTEGAQAAKDVLSNSANWNIKLYVTDKDPEPEIKDNSNEKRIEDPSIMPKEKYFFFKDRVMEICFLLEKAIDQTNQAINEGALKGTPRNILGGFNFMDAATRNPLSPITAKLQIADFGRGWVDLVDSLGALTLFGNNFGELIKPGEGNAAKSCSQCGFEVSLPSKKDLLAVCVDVLEKIIEQRDGKDTTPWLLIDDNYWHLDGSDFEPCRCTSSNGRSGDRDRVQTMNTTLAAPASPAAQDESSEINENHLSDTVSSTTPDAFTSSRVEGSCSNDTTVDHQRPSSEVVSTKPDIKTFPPQITSGTGISDSDNTTDEQQSSTPNAVPVQPKVIAVTPHIVSNSLQTISRKRAVAKIKGIYTWTWKKLKARKTRLTGS